MGNAQRMIARHGTRLRYCHPWKQALVWDTQRWAIDDTAEVERMAKETAQAIALEAYGQSGQQFKELTKWASVSQSRERISAMTSLAMSELSIPILPAEMDCNPWALNCANGTLDLRAGNLREHDPSDMITQLCPTEFDPRANCPLWLATLAKFLVKPELIAFFNRLVGYMITGVIQDQILALAHGRGANGKSTILGTLQNVLGFDYSMKCAPDLLMSKRGESHPTDKTDLFRKRFVVAIETESGRRLNETIAKELTGGDRIRARRMRENFWEFTPTHKIIVATNHRPSVQSGSSATWRRIKLIPFGVAVSGLDDDKKMPEKLRAEYPGILTWCVQGCLDWQRRGLDPPQEVIQATQEYESAEDRIGRFIEAWVDNDPAQDRSKDVQARELYTWYANWAKEGNEDVMSETLFGESMSELGFKKYKRTGRIYYRGLSLRLVVNTSNP
jgi:putative DNA primase/helicase